MKPKLLVSMMTAALVFTVLVFSGAAGAEGTIVITDGTTTVLSSDDVGTTVSGSQGGYAKLAAVDGDTWTLELHDFNAAAENNRIMHATGIANLRIVLNGTSNLVGAYDDYADGLLAVEMGNLTITTLDGTSGSLVVNNTVTWDNFSAFAVSASALTVDSGAEVTAIATISTPHMAYAFSIEEGDICIRGEDTVVTAIAVGGTTAHGLDASRNMLIEDGATVHAQTLSQSDYEIVHPISTALASWNGDIVISGSARVTAVSEAADTAYAYTIRSNQITVENSVVNASATSRNARAAALIADRNIVIDAGTSLHAAAAGMPGYAIVVGAADGRILVSDCDLLAATGSNSSFVLKNADNFAIASLADTHTFQNGTEPISYGDLADDWHSCAYSAFFAYQDEQFNASNYTAVTIAGKAATNQSPAPFVGILAGLGAAAVVLTRMRK